MTEATEKTPFHWKSNIAWKNRDRIVVRGYDVNELAGNLDFGQMLFLVLKGELPTEAQARITNAMMVSLAEHAMSPSSATVRFATSGGAELNGAVSAGVAPSENSDMVQPLSLQMQGLDWYDGPADRELPAGFGVSGEAG